MRFFNRGGGKESSIGEEAEQSKTEEIKKHVEALRQNIDKYNGYKFYRAGKAYTVENGNLVDYNNKIRKLDYLAFVTEQRHTECIDKEFGDIEPEYLTVAQNIPKDSPIPLVMQGTCEPAPGTYMVAGYSGRYLIRAVEEVEAPN